MYDQTGLIQLQQQVDELKNTFDQQIYIQKQSLYQINNILFSGQNLDQFGKPTLNPMIQSSFKFIKHNDSFEQIMAIGGANNWWESITFPGEFLQLNGNQVSVRFDQGKQLYANFDYRFANVKQMPIVLDTFLQNKLQQINDIIQQLDSVFQQGWFKLLYQNEVSQINEINNTKNIFDFLTILVDYQNWKNNPGSFVDPAQLESSTKLTIKTFDSLKLVLKLTQLIEAYQSIQVQKEDYTFQYRYVITKEKQEVQKNIFQGAIQNVYIFASENQSVYLDPEGSFKNIYIENSDNICLFGSQNLTIKNSNNIYMQKSINQGKIQFDSVSNFFIDQNFCENGGQFSFNNIREPSVNNFMIVRRLSFMSSTVNFTELYDYNIFIDNRSFEFCQCNMMYINNVQMIIDMLTFINAEVNIKNSFNDGFIWLQRQCCNNGQLLCVPGSFNDGGILSFKSNNVFGDNNYQSLILEKDMKIFYMQDTFKDISIGENTQYVIQNSIVKAVGILSSGEATLSYDNGPFTLEQVYMRLRENTYIQPSLPGPQWMQLVDSREIKSEWFGHQLINTVEKPAHFQYLKEWDRLDITSGGIPINSIETNTGKHIVSQIQFIDDYINLITDTLEVNDFISHINISLFLQQTNTTIQQIKVNGNVCDYSRGAKYSIYINENVNQQLSIKFDKLTSQIIIMGGEKLTRFNFSFGGIAEELRNIFISEKLIQKILTPQPELFNGASKFNPVQFIQHLPIFSEKCFQGTTIIFDQPLTSLVTNIPDFCFSQSTVRGTSINLPNVVNVGNYAFQFMQGQDRIAINLPNYVHNASFINQFFRNSQLQSISLNNTQNNIISSGMFQLCENLTFIQGAISEVLNFGFYRCISLSDQINLIQSVKLNEQAFYQCSLLNVNNLNVSQLGKQCFYECGEQQTVYLNVLKIPEQSFYKCVKLRLVQGAQYVQEIELGAFDYCRLLTSINLQQCRVFGARCFAHSGLLDLSINATVLGESAFKNCFNLSAVSINAPIISESCFEDCQTLASVYFGNAQTVLQDYAFRNSYSLRIVTGQTQYGLSVGEQCFTGTILQGNITVYHAEQNAFAYLNTRDSELTINIKGFNKEVIFGLQNMIKYETTDIVVTIHNNEDYHYIAGIIDSNKSKYINVTAEQTAIVY